MESISVEKKNNVIAGIGTLVFVSILFLIAYWWIIVTPIPPFEPSKKEFVELSMIDLGNLIEGTGTVDNTGMGDDNPSGNTSSAASSGEQTEESSTVITSDVEKTVAVKNHTVKNKKTSTSDKQEEPVPSTELNNALNKFKTKKSGNPGGDGNSGKNGDLGDPNGHPDGDPWGKKYGLNLKGRMMVKRPDIIDDSQEEGKVVVEIVVDETGKVIKANPGERGSTTTSALLFAKARQAALSSKFNPSPDGTKEQRGTITFVFILN